VMTAAKTMIKRHITIDTHCVTSHETEESLERPKTLTTTPENAQTGHDRLGGVPCERSSDVGISDEPPLAAA
ncbi:hypothetical protein, partial [Amycolatopsis japonica]